MNYCLRLGKIVAMSSLLVGLVGCPNGDSGSPAFYGFTDNTVVVTLSGVGQGPLALSAGGRFFAPGGAIDPTFEEDGDCFFASLANTGFGRTERSAGTIKVTSSSGAQEMSWNGETYDDVTIDNASTLVGTAITFEQTDATAVLGTWKGSVTVATPVQLVEWPWKEPNPTDDNDRTKQSISNDLLLKWQSPATDDQLAVQIAPESGNASRLVQCVVPMGQQQLVISKKLLQKLGAGPAIAATGSVRHATTKSQKGDTIELLSVASASKDGKEQTYFPLDLVP